MLLYQIRNKHTGLYLVSKINPSSEGYWNASGCFWKTIDTVKKHVDHLMHEWEASPSESKLYFYWHKTRYAKEREGTFVVIVHNVKMLGETSYPAENLLKEKTL